MFVVLGSRTEATQRLPRGMTANRMGLSSYDGDHDRKCNPWHPGGGLADDDVVIDAPPIITSGIKIKTTFDTSTPAITAAISPIAATMANIPKTFSPVRRTDLGYPRTTQLRGRLPAVRLPQHADSTARSVRSSSQSIRSRRRCGLRVRRNLLDDRGSPLDDSAHGGGLGPVLLLLGIAMLVNFERIDAWQQRRFLRRPITPTRWQARRSSCSE